MGSGTTAGRKEKRGLGKRRCGFQGKLIRGFLGYQAALPVSSAAGGPAQRLPDSVAGKGTGFAALPAGLAQPEPGADGDAPAWTQAGARSATVPLPPRKVLREPQG